MTKNAASRRQRIISTACRRAIFEAFEGRLLRSVSVASGNIGPWFIYDSTTWKNEPDHRLHAEAGSLAYPDTAVPANIPAVYQLVKDVGHGSLSLTSDGSFSYLPAPDFRGYDTFKYRVSATNDDTLTTSIAQVTVSVYPTPILGSNDVYYVDAEYGEYTVTFRPTENDGDTGGVLAKNFTGQPAVGTINDNGDGSYTYNINSNGLQGQHGDIVEGFTYTASGGRVDGNTVNVDIIVHVDNNYVGAPIVGALHAAIFTTTRNQTLTTSVPSPNSEPFLPAGFTPDDPNSPSSGGWQTVIMQPLHGSLVVNADQTLTYIPNNSYVGYDYFSVQTSHQNGADVDVWGAPQTYAVNVTEWVLLA